MQHGANHQAIPLCNPRGGHGWSEVRVSLGVVYPLYTNTLVNSLHTTHYNSPSLTIASQLAVLASVPAYLASIAMAYCIRKHSSVYFPGVSMLIAACYYLGGWCIHYLSYGSRAAALVKRVEGKSEQEAMFA